MKRIDGKLRLEIQNYYNKSGSSDWSLIINNIVNKMYDWFFTQLGEDSRVFDLFLFHTTNLPSNQERDTKNFLVLDEERDALMKLRVFLL